MRRSKYGYLLLALLVVTGLAGTVTPTSITSKERKFAASNLKDTKTDVLTSIEGLTNYQLDYKAPGKPTVKECAYSIASVEESLWELLQTTLKQPSSPAKRSEIRLTDEQLIRLIEDRTKDLKIDKALKYQNTKYKSLDEALESFKEIRTDHIKYIKNTTEDLRNHVVKMPFGLLDCYQLCLLISAYSNREMQKIEEIKASSNFPSR
jgi:hypothetical protein